MNASNFNMPNLPAGVPTIEELLARMDHPKSGRPITEKLSEVVVDVAGGFEHFASRVGAALTAGFNDGFTSYHEELKRQAVRKAQRIQRSMATLER